MSDTGVEAAPLRSGHTMAAVNAVGTILPYSESGKMHVLMSLDARPMFWWPGLPAVKESAYDLVHPAPYGLSGRTTGRRQLSSCTRRSKVAAESDEYGRSLNQNGRLFGAT